MAGTAVAAAIAVARRRVSSAAASRVSSRGVTCHWSTSSRYSARCWLGGLGTGAAGTDQQVAWGVLGVDELHHLGPVPVHPQQPGAQCVGEHVGEALAQDALPGQQLVRCRGGVGAELLRQVVVAARRGQHPAGLPAHRAGQRLVRGGVAGVQRQHQVGGGVDDGVGDRAGHEADLVGPAQPLRQLGVAPPLVLPDVHADQLDVEPPTCQVAVRGERQVGVAAAQVDHPQRTGQVVGQGRGQGTQERVHLAALGRRAADLGEDRVTGVEQVFLRPVVPARRRPPDGTSRPGAPAPRRTWSPAVGGSRRPSPRASCRTARPAVRRSPRSASGPEATLRVYGRAPSEVAICIAGPGLEPHRPQFGPANSGAAPTASSGGDRPGQRGVEQQRPNLGQGSVQWFRHRSIFGRWGGEGNIPRTARGGAGDVRCGWWSVRGRLGRRTRTGTATTAAPAAARLRRLAVGRGGRLGVAAGIGGDHRGRLARDRLAGPAATPAARGTGAFVGGVGRGCLGLGRCRRAGVGAVAAAVAPTTALASTLTTALAASGAPDHRCRPDGSGSSRPGPLRSRRTARPGCARPSAGCR